jgi:hypothetical protein
MEPEGSLPRSQKPSTGPYSEPINPIHTIPSYLSKIHFNIATHLLGGSLPCHQGMARPQVEDGGDAL